MVSKNPKRQLPRFETLEELMQTMEVFSEMKIPREARWEERIYAVEIIGPYVTHTCNGIGDMDFESFKRRHLTMKDLIIGIQERRSTATEKHGSDTAKYI